jgi:hypothetical protein
MIRWIWAPLIAALMALEIGLSAMTAIAQTEPGGAFDKLSPGNRKVARALFEAQTSPPLPGTRRLPLDQIAAQKQSGEGWGGIFRSMKSQRLIQSRTLGRAISSFEHRHHLASWGATVTTAGNRTVAMHEARGPHRFDGDHNHDDLVVRPHEVRARATESAAVEARAGMSAAARVHSGGRGK